MSDSLIAAIEKELNISFHSPNLDSRQKLTYLLGRKYTELERKEMIRSIATNFPTKVYGDDSWLAVKAPHLQYMGHADHFLTMPKVFRLSKININLTRAYVPSGLPMRVFDILASQGFLLTNDRQDLHTLFQPGRDLALFSNLDHLLTQIEYYLSKEQERLEMIAHSQQTIRHHTFENRLLQMMHLLGEGALGGGSAPSTPGKGAWPLCKPVSLIALRPLISANVWLERPAKCGPISSTCHHFFSRFKPAAAGFKPLAGSSIF